MLVDFVWMGIAIFAAGMAGWCFTRLWFYRKETFQKKQKMRTSFTEENRKYVMSEKGWTVRFVKEVTHKLSLRATTSFSRHLPHAKARRWFDVHLKKSGLSEEVSFEGFFEASFRLSIAGLLMGLLLGMTLSAQLGIVGGIVGLIVGAARLPREIVNLEKKREELLEHHLSEMLEVISLGLRSGLSFDQSFRLYGTHFDVPFAQECASAQRAWTFGLVAREDALRNLAATYNSALFSRVVESVVRSLRFGSSLAESLEACAVEARAQRRANVEERVAKAPIKMMVPTGVLILPAMLLLVLGPVLLELMEGI